MNDETEAAERDGEELWLQFLRGRSAPETACPDETVLAAYVDDRVGEEERAAVERHLCDCDRCRAAVMETRLAIGESAGPLPSGLERRAKALVGDRVAAAPVPVAGRVLKFPGWAVVNWAAAAAACLVVSYCGYALGQRTARDREQIERKTVDSMLPGSVLRETLI